MSSRGRSLANRPRRLGAREAALAVSGLVGIVALAWYRGQVGDYRPEVEPALNALADGDFWRAIDRQSFIGPFSLVLRAPLVAVAHALGAGELVSYRVGAAACLAAAALLAVALVRWSRTRDRRRPVVELLIVVLAVATPAATEALSLGHPEEILAAALAVGAMVACLRGRYWWAALLLGLALATKQWTLLAIGPAMLAAGPYWRRVALPACGIIALATLVLLVADYETFLAATRLAASAPSAPLFQNWWYLVHRDLPFWFVAKLKPAIVVSAVPLTIIAWRRGGGSRSALPLLALLFVVRCVFDTQTQYYYHLPLVLTLLAWDVQMRRRLPYTTLATVGALLVTNTYIAQYGHFYAASIVYFVWTLALAAYLLHVIAWPRVGEHVALRKRVVGVDGHLRDAGDPGAAANRRHDRAAAGDDAFRDNAPLEA